MKLLLNILRIVVGVLFIFSGLVKANDPLGLAYKMDEFFEALHLVFLSPYSLYLSVCLNVLEILCGVAMIFGYAMRFFSSLILILITFFTFLTAYALFSGKIRECGCFGDCIPLSPQATFWKDVALEVMIIIIFLYRKTITSLLGRNGSIMVLLTTFLVSIGVQLYALQHLPYVDCLAYKIGNNIPEKMKLPPGATPDVYETVLIYEKNGERKEFTTDNFPWQDSTWKYVDRRDKLVKEGNAVPAIKDFSLKDFDGGDHTQELLAETKPVYLLMVQNVHEAGEDWEESIRNLQQQLRAGKIELVGVTASAKPDVDTFTAHRGLLFPFLSMDATAIKTAARNNPTLILLDKGTIRAKWAYRDFPSFKN
ncbi:DoxX family protein [Chitinophaga parva]|uniref:DoxX family protein n=1 Tax=Chitinophaga parva TaxID=2169414 RepID=A0A2T7BDF3_9BACT|nr:BT_3928 family protein [Chitinophaga parva]PUZ23123.1 DoxX family protein [Chitinophaga parva]